MRLTTRPPTTHYARQPSLATGTGGNHYFPASDIPAQARALYVRNRVRLIPDVSYTPAPLVSLSGDLTGLDMSDLFLRSVSPVHIQYLKNMDVGASASVSIVIDGELWGLVACHSRLATYIPYDVRLACDALADNLARQVRGLDEAEHYRERIRLRSLEDAVVYRLGAQDRWNSSSALRDPSCVGCWRWTVSPPCRETPTSSDGLWPVTSRIQKKLNTFACIYGNYRVLNGHCWASLSRRFPRKKR